jgi:Prokaryotic E2 family E
VLPPDDIKYLEDRLGNGSYSIVTEANMTCIVFKDYRLPAGFDHEKSDLLIRLNAGYPDVPPDMWWFDPPARRVDGKPIPATEVIEHHLGRGWQRWSRHFRAGQWRSGIDSVESFLALVNKELNKSVQGSV